MTPERIAELRDLLANYLTRSSDENKLLAFASEFLDAADKLARLTALLEPLRPLEAAATDAPWGYWPGYGISPEPGCTISFDDMDCDYDEDEGGEPPPAPANTAFVIAARNALAEMLRVVGS